MGQKCAEAIGSNVVFVQHRVDLSSQLALPSLLSQLLSAQPVAPMIQKRATEMPRTTIQKGRIMAFD
jgi:hypothetical protein